MAVAASSSEFQSNLGPSAIHPVCDNFRGLLPSIEIPKSRGFAAQHFVVRGFQVHGQTAVPRGPDYLDGLSSFGHPVRIAVNAWLDTGSGPHEIAPGLRTLSSLLSQELNSSRGSNQRFIISELHFREPWRHGQGIATLKYFWIQQLRVLLRGKLWA